MPYGSQRVPGGATTLPTPVWQPAGFPAGAPPSQRSGPGGINLPGFVDLPSVAATLDTTFIGAGVLDQVEPVSVSTGVGTLAGAGVVTLIEPASVETAVMGATGAGSTKLAEPASTETAVFGASGAGVLSSSTSASMSATASLAGAGVVVENLPPSNSVLSGSLSGSGTVVTYGGSDMAATGTIQGTGVVLQVLPNAPLSATLDMLIFLGGNVVNGPTVILALETDFSGSGELPGGNVMTGRVAGRLAIGHGELARTKAGRIA